MQTLSIDTQNGPEEIDLDNIKSVVPIKDSSGNITGYKINFKEGTSMTVPATARNQSIFERFLLSQTLTQNEDDENDDSSGYSP